MRVQLGETVRGSYKIYIHVTVEDALEGAPAPTLEARASAAGRGVPAKVATVPDVPGHVVIIPVLEVDQDLVVTARAAGQTATATKTIAPRAAQFQSQLNTLRRNPIGAKIRNCDQKKPVWREPAIEIDRVIRVDDRTDIVHGHVTFDAETPAQVAGDVHVATLDPSAAEASLTPWVLMGDATETQDPDGVSLRRVAFSLKIPHDLPQMIVWVQVDNPAVPDAFERFWKEGLDPYRESFHMQTLSAQSDLRYEDQFLRARATDRDLEEQRRRAFAIRPLFSIIVPLYRTPLPYFEQMVDSVLAQSYDRFELLLVNASPEDEGLAAAVARRTQADPRVREIRLDANRGITENTNAGIRAAMGDFLAFLDHDDFIEPDLLYRYVDGINQYPETDLLYCDEDKLLDGILQMPFFKPDWNPELLCSMNYVAHLLAVRKSIVDAMDLPGSEYDGAQDQHMTLRVAEHARNIYHARRVLYHWRVHASSTAANPGSKTYTSEAGVRAVQTHLDRLGLAATARLNPAFPNTYFVDYDLADEPLVSIVIPNKDAAPMLERCLASIDTKSTYKNYEVVVVENNSTDPATFAYYETLPAVHPKARVVTYAAGGGFNFSALINYGASQSRGAYLVMLNNDTEVISPDWLERLVGPLTNPAVGAVGAKLLYPDGTIQHAGVAFREYYGPGHIGQFLWGESDHYFNMLSMTQDLHAVTGACLATRRDLYDQLGGLDEDAFAVDYNDIDYCLRLWDAGKRVVYEPRARLVHYESVSRGFHEGRARGLQFRREIATLMQRQPAYFHFHDTLMSQNFKSECSYRGLGILTEANREDMRSRW